MSGVTLYEKAACAKHWSHSLPHKLTQIFRIAFNRRWTRSH